MSIICKQCGYENPDGATECEICAEPLDVKQPVTGIQAQPDKQVTIREEQYIPPADDGNEYYVYCQESQTKTIVPSGNVTEFYCMGCKKRHEIDGFIWEIGRRPKNPAEAQGVRTANTNAGTNPYSNPNSNAGVPEAGRATCKPATDNLWLEEMTTHTRIDITKPGGTLGRYGNFGADFFTSRNMLTVSGEHCAFAYQYGIWIIRHMSRTNQTVYNNITMNANEPIAMEDGKVLTLANTVSFLVRIG